MKKLIWSLIWAMMPLALFSQQSIVREEWNTKPVLHTIDAKHQSEAVI